VVGGEVNEGAVNLLLVFGASAILQVQLEVGAYRPEHFRWEEIVQHGIGFIEDVVGFDLSDKGLKSVGCDAFVPEQDFD
jgi:hypothetical protein